MLPPCRMNASTILSSVLALGLALVGCAADPAEEGATTDSALASATCPENLPQDAVCVVTADLGAKLRSEANAGSEDILSSEGWGGLPCGYQFHVDVAKFGAPALGCSTWAHGSASVNGEKTSGYVNASLLTCRRANETNEDFLKRFTPVCTNFANGSGEPLPDPDTCEPGAGWTKAASHDGIALDHGAGGDSALVTTGGSTAKIAAVFKAYRVNGKGQTDYVGCFRTRVSGAYGKNISAAYTLNTTEGFYEYEGAVKTYASWADVDYYVVEGNASIR